MDPNSNQAYKCTTPLTDAARLGFSQVLECLIKYGALIKQKDATGNTAMHWAAFCGHEDCVELLARWGANINQMNYLSYSPIMMAAWSGHANCVALLIQLGAKRGLQTHCGGDSALTLASEKVCLSDESGLYRLSFYE